MRVTADRNGETREPNVAHEGEQDDIRNGLEAICSAPVAMREGYARGT